MQRWNCCRRGGRRAVIALRLGKFVETTQIDDLHAHLAPPRRPPVAILTALHGQPHERQSVRTAPRAPRRQRYRRQDARQDRRRTPINITRGVHHRRCDGHRTRCANATPIVPPTILPRKLIAAPSCHECAGALAPKEAAVVSSMPSPLSFSDRASRTSFQSSPRWEGEAARIGS